MKKRLAGLLTVVGLGVLGLAPTAGAAPPTHTPFDITFTETVTDICPFPVHILGHVTGRDTSFPDQNGNEVKFIDHVVEQDVFSAHGVSIRTFPYHYNVRGLENAAGDLLHVWTTGTVVRMRLPDGTLFNSAGRFDALQRDDAFFIVPITGHSGNVAAFCAALS